MKSLDRLRGMANRQRALLLGLAAVVAVVALVVVGGSGGDEDDGVIDTRTTATTEAEPGRTQTMTAVPTNPAEASEPTTPVVVVRDGKPVGGVERLRFRKGGDIVFDVRSNGTGHAHLHGYDVLKDLVPGKRVRFKVPATIDGRFELELEDTATLIAEIEVVP
jgi:hypothetical protein